MKNDENSVNPTEGQPQQQIQLRISDEILKGVYSTQAMIRHTKQEFILDFVSYIPGDSSGVVSSRVILSPEHTKGLLKALEENIKRYETQFQPIEAGSNPQPNFGFRTE
jgi:hypothetical protein